MGAQVPIATPQRSQNERQTSQQGGPPTGWGRVISWTLTLPSPVLPLQLAPEHTLMSFRKALEQKLYGLQADITIRFGGGHSPPHPHPTSASGSPYKTSCPCLGNGRGMKAWLVHNRPGSLLVPMRFVPDSRIERTGSCSGRV